MTLLFILFFTSPTKIFPVPHQDIIVSRVLNFRVQDAGIFTNDPDTLYQFDFDGQLVMQIQGGPDSFQLIRAFYVAPDFIWIVDKISLSSFFYDHNGDFLFKAEGVYSNNIQSLGGDTYVISPGYVTNDSRKLSPFLRFTNFLTGPYPRMLKTMELNITPKGIKGIKELQSFYKATESLSKLNLEFRKLWAFKDANSFSVINQIDNFKAVYSPYHIDQERQIPPDKPYQPRITPLNLPHFVEYTEPFQAQPFYEDVHDHAREIKCWLYRRSFIENVVQTDHGYLIGYTVPKVKCERGWLVVTKMNRDFRSQGIALELDRHGILMGTHNDKIYVMVPNYEIDNVITVGAKPEIWVFDLNE